jgi:DNA (cytosine-5)-methyltransferase 1
VDVGPGRGRSAAPASRLSPKQLRVTELFCGIGGLAAALPPGADVLAVDQSELARQSYAHNFGHTPKAWNIAGLKSLPKHDLLWLSPPCQPYTQRGAQRDLADKRSAALLRVCALLPLAQPRFVGLENVPQFQGSEGHAHFLEALDGYQIWQGVLCPSQLGIPNKRRRFYILASRRGQIAEPVFAPEDLSLDRYLDPHPDPSLFLSDSDTARLLGVLPIITLAQSTETFTSGYGRSLLKAGSLLRMIDGRVRRFSPQEILRLHGFPNGFELAPGLDQVKQYKLVGNSLSVPVVRVLLNALGLDAQ